MIEKKNISKKSKNKLDQCIRVIGKILAIALLLCFVLIVIGSFIDIFDANQKLLLLAISLMISYCLLAIAAYEL